MRVLLTVIVFAVLATSNASTAKDPVNEKLDVILNEIRVLSGRLEALEDRMDTLEKARDTKTLITLPRKANPPIPQSWLMRQKSKSAPTEVLRLQFEQPERLMKDIHERERLLRKRLFLPDLYSPQ